MTVSVMILLAFLQIVPATASAVMNVSPAKTTNDADLSIRLLDIPASTQNDPRARTYIIDRLAPGDEIKRRIHVENNSATAQTVHLYSGAARIADGAFVGEAAGVKNDLSTWTTLAEPEVTLKTGESADVPVTIAVPADAPEGEQYGAVWAEMRSAADKSGVAQASRVGIRIYLSVGPGNGTAADFTITSLEPSRSQTGDPQLSALVTNTGGRALDVTGELSLTGGPGGLSAGPFSLKSATTIAPGKTQNITFVLPKELPNGPWTAGLKLKSGLLERNASAAITFPDAGSGEAVTPVQSGGNQGLLFAAIAGALLIVIITALLILRRNRLRIRTLAQENPEPGQRRGNRVRTDA
ncbi:hypothetical protein [Pseudarthrobacter sulfonivorans]|uniref:hypothetical protein n=1 Tax=Pseudarthrobacter sulfonivorans TaxID=121292 RepID=UPI00168A43ED|nr:hypothetical protein [Pseudarthrobacter sulfonivorans]